MAKKKLTLSIEEDVIAAARHYSEQNDISISRIVTLYLQALTSASGGNSPVVERLRGILHADADRETYRRYLREKYGS